MTGFPIPALSRSLSGYRLCAPDTVCRKTSSSLLSDFRCFLQFYSVFFFCDFVHSYCFTFRLSAVGFFKSVPVDIFHQRLNSAIFLCETGYFCFLFFHRISASCAFYVSIAKATYCPSLPSRVITSFTGTMDESDSSTVFVRFHHCIGRYSLLAPVQNCPGLPGMPDITISGMPCSRTPVCFHNLALTIIPCW